MGTPKTGTPSATGRSLRGWFRGCLITFVFGLLLVFMLSSLGMASLLHMSGAV